MQLPTRLRASLLLAIVGVVTACASGTSLPASEGWSVIMEEGAEGHGPEAYWSARLIAGDSGLLLIANREQTPFERYQLWHSSDGESWEASTLEPPDGYTGVELWVAVPTPDQFLLAGIASSDVEGDRKVVMWTGGRTHWDPVEDFTVGLPAVVAQLIHSDCLCGFLNNVIGLDSGLIAIGQDANNLNAVWLSSDGEDWAPITLGASPYGGVMGIALLSEQLYAVGTAPGFAVWTSDDGSTWDVVADGSDFDLPAIPIGADVDSDPEWVDAGMSGQFMGMTTHDAELWTLMSLRVPRGEDACAGPIIECNHDTLALYRSSDGLAWDRVSLPEEMRWAPHGGSMVELDGRMMIAETSDGRLQVWANDDPGTQQAADPEPDGDKERDAFVALKTRLADEIGGYRVLEIEAPLSVEIADDGWSPTRVVLTGVQTEVTLVLEVANRYLGSDGIFSADSDVEQVRLPHGESFRIELEVGETPLPSGLHEFRLEIPAWINPEGVTDGTSDGTVELTLTYNVFDADRIRATSEFCESVIPLVDGLAPTDPDFERIRELATDLDDEVRDPLLEAADQVQAEIDRPLTEGYDTSPLVGAVGDVCGRYDMYSVAGIA